MGIFKEFKDFALRGNVVDLAVGIIIGASFGKIVSSLVDDVIMPPIGLALNGVNFRDIKIPIKGAYTDVAGVVHTAVTINVGNFIQVVIDFLIVAFAIFVLVRAMNRVKVQEALAPVAAAPTKEEELLTEIRDLLKK